MSKKKNIKNSSFKEKYTKLEKQFYKIQTENSLLKMCHKITSEDKFKAIEDYFAWCGHEGNDCSRAETFGLYKEHLRYREKRE